MEDSTAVPRQTKQRDAIISILRTALGPLSVQDIHEQAQRVLPQLGMATVYRTIKLLHESGQIHGVNIAGELRYERTGLSHHHHFYCRACGLALDLNLCPLAQHIQLPAGYVLETHEITLYGLCPNCASKA